MFLDTRGAGVRALALRVIEERLIRTGMHAQLQLQLMYADTVLERGDAPIELI